MRRRGTYTRQDLLTCKASTLNPGSGSSTLRLLSPLRNSLSFQGFQAFSHRFALTRGRNVELAHFPFSLPVLEIHSLSGFFPFLGSRSNRTFNYIVWTCSSPVWISLSYTRQLPADLVERTRNRISSPDLSVVCTVRSNQSLPQNALRQPSMAVELSTKSSKEPQPSENRNEHSRRISSSAGCNRELYASEEQNRKSTLFKAPSDRVIRVTQVNVPIGTLFSSSMMELSTFKKLTKARNQER